MKKTGLLIILLLFGIIFISAQNINNLEKELKTAEGNRKVEILNILSQHYINTNSKKSLKLAKNAYELSKKLNNKKLLANSSNVLAAVYFEQKKYRLSIKYYEKELNLRNNLKQYYSAIKAQYNLASVYQISGKEKKALQLYKDVLNSAKKKNYSILIKKTYQAIIQTYRDIKDYKYAFLYLQEYFDYINNIKTNYTKQRISILETKFEENEKELNIKANRLKQIDSVLNILLIEKSTLVEDTIVKGEAINKLAIDTIKKAEVIKIKKAEVKEREQWLLYALTIIGIILIFSILLIWMYRQKKEAYKLLALQNAEILEKNEEIKSQSEEILKRNKEIQIKKDKIELQAKELEKHHKLTLQQKQEIVDSINYAKRIQQAVFPTKNYINKILNDYFIFFKPRDIVSGDFYWMKKIDNYVIVVAADSTGHGVPGAFMSMLGVSFLNEIVNSENISNAGAILNKLRTKVKNSLHQTDKDSLMQDGMDIAFYIINTESLELQYSGAYNPLFIVRDNNGAELIEIKADRQPIAIYLREKDFTNHSYQLKKGDCLYTFSDGYADQFGGKKGVKFKLKNFKQMLLNINNLSMSKQEQVLSDTLTEWMGDKYEQLDDILVLGVRVDF